MLQPQWKGFDEADGVASAAAAYIAECARDAIADRGEFRLVLAGGTTPLACYRKLVTQNSDRTRWKLFYGDERCLPKDHADLNHRMVEETGLVRGVAGHYVIPVGKGAETGARLYAQTIIDQMPFDLVLLGMGEDGHTASLFPGHEQELSDAGLVVPVHDAPKPPPDRISLSVRVLQSCRKMLLLLTGEGKREPLTRWRAGTYLPIARVMDTGSSLAYVEKSLLERKT